MKVFIDTNILVDYVAQRDDFYEPAASLFELISRHQLAGVISSLSIVNCVYVLRKYFDISIVLTKLNQLLNLVEVSPINKNHISLSIHANSSDFEDAVQYFSAEGCHCDIIIT